MRRKEKLLLWGLIFLGFCVGVGAWLGFRQVAPKKACIRSHVEVNNIPERTVTECTKFTPGVGRCDRYVTTQLPAERQETPVCDEYEK